MDRKEKKPYFYTIIITHILFHRLREYCYPSETSYKFSY